VVASLGVAALAAVVVVAVDFRPPFREAEGRQEAPARGQNLVHFSYLVLPVAVPLVLAGNQNNFT
jgi:hypothetical protein